MTLNCLGLSCILFNNCLILRQQKTFIMSAVDFDKNFINLESSLRSFAYNLTKNEEDAHDLYQETALRAVSNREKFNPGTNFKAWLFTIMKNIFINNYRKKVKKNTIIDSTENMYFLNSGSVVISNDAGANMLMKELHKMIDSLEDSIKIPFMKHFEGFKYQEIADELVLPLGTVKSRIFFARKALKAKIKAHYGDYNLVRSRQTA